MVCNHLFRNYITNDMTIGVYINNNTEPILEGPNPISEGIDTLILMKNNHYTSKAWGNSTYEIKNGLERTEIEFSYSDNFGKTGLNTIICRTILGEQWIWLNRDHYFYFEKIK